MNNGKSTNTALFVSLTGEEDLTFLNEVSLRGAFILLEAKKKRNYNVVVQNLTFVDNE